MRRVNRRGHDVALLQVVSKQEVDLPFSGDLEFEADQVERRRHITTRLDAYLTIEGDAPPFGGAVERAVTPRIVTDLYAEAAFYDTLPAAGR